MNNFNFVQEYPVLVVLACTVVLMLAPLILAFVLWLITKLTGWFKQTKQPKFRWLTAYYILASLPPLLWLMAPEILAQVARPNIIPLTAVYYVLRFRAEDWFMLPTGLLFLVFVMYLFAGIKDDQTYTDIFSPRKFVWFVFGLVVMFVAWFVPNTLLKAQAQFTGMHVDLVVDIGEAIEDLSIDANCLNNNCSKNDVTEPVLSQAEALELSLDLLQASVGADPEIFRAPLQLTENLAAAMAEIESEKLSKETAPAIASELGAVSRMAAEVQTAVRRLDFSVSVARVNIETQEQAKELLRQVEEDLLPKINKTKILIEVVAIGEDDTVVKEAQDALIELQRLVGAIKEPAKDTIVFKARTLADKRVDIELNNGFGEHTRDTILRTTAQMQVLVDDIQIQVVQLNKDKDGMYIWRANEVRDKVRALELAAVALKIDSGTPMLMVALLFIVFLLIPWLLFISFIIGKREQIINDRLDFLTDLNLIQRFRTASSLIRDRTIEAANSARSANLDWLKNVKSDDPEYKASVALQKAVELAKELDALKRGPKDAEKEEINRLADSEILNRQTFHSREYIIPLLILTTLTLVGWYFTIFANGSNGLVKFIEQGGGSLQLNTLLAQFTSFTMVFAGAWLFMIITLTYRWVSNDLYPGSYFYASMRLVYGLLVGMVFLAFFGNGSTEATQFWLPIAFFVGIAPIEFVNALWKTIKGGAGWIDDKLIHKYASQILKYFERPEWASRQPLTLLEDITIWDDSRLMQEGIQNVHALATADLARLAMRTPYDAQTLIDWVDQAVLRVHTKVLWHAGLSAIGVRGATDLIDVCGVDDQGNSNTEKVNCVVDAFNAAQLMSITSDDPRFDAYNQAAKLETASQSLAEQAKAARESNAKLEPAKEQTLDNIIALRQQVDQLAGQVTQAIAARKALYGALTSIIGPDAASWTNDTGQLGQQLNALKEGDKSIERIQIAIKPEMLTRDLLESDLAQAANAEKPGQAALKTAQDAIDVLLDPIDKAKKALDSAPHVKTVMIAKAATDALKTKVDQLLGKAVAAQKQAAGLSQTNHAETTARLDELLAAAKVAESAAGDLVTALDAGGEALKANKDKAISLKEKLDAGAGQLQAKIAAAKDKVANLATDIEGLAEARKAVKAIATHVGTEKSTGDSTISGKMKAIAEPFNDIETKLTQLTTAITVLETVIAAAHTLAQNIKKDDATTWDNVKALANLLSALTKAIANADAAHSDIKKKLDKLDAQQTLALREARKNINNLSMTDAKETAETAQKAFKQDDNFVLSASSLQSELVEAKTKVELAVKASETLVSAVDSATEEASRAVLPLRLTRHILEVIIGAIHCDPNIHSIRHYWRTQVKKIEDANKPKTR